MTLDRTVLPPHVVGYADFFAAMTAETVPHLHELVTADVHFRDPFNDVHGADRMMRIMAHMYETCDEVGFSTTGAVAGQDSAYLSWTFRFRPRRLRGPTWQVDGVTELHFNGQGLVAAHLDYWDSGGQFYARLPGLGWLVRRIGRRLQVA
jgi:steroid delta-isomerase